MSSLLDILFINKRVSPVSMSFRSRKYVFTINNPVPGRAEDLLQLTARYICFGKEVAPTTGTPHLQGFVYFSNGKTLSAVRKLIVGAHVESARGSFAQCIAYCQKDGDFHERGEKPLDAVEQGDGERRRWADALESARRGDFDEIDPQILLCHYGAISRIRGDCIVVPESLPTTTGIWIVGPSGSGKSRGCRTQFPGLYPKPLNKWWDGYKFEPVVLLDDVDRSHSQWIGGFLKIWADHYGFIAEAKGKSLSIRPERFLVTSQYHIADLFSTDGPLVEALERRFITIPCTPDIPIPWELGF